MRVSKLYLFKRSEGEKYHEMNLGKKGDEFDRMQAVRNFKKLGESENIEYSAKNVKSKSKKSKVKKAKKMKPLEEDFDEPIIEPFDESYNNKMHMSSAEKFTVNAVKGGNLQSKIQSIKNDKFSAVKVRSAANNVKGTSSVKRPEKPISIDNTNSNNMFTIEKTPKSKNTKTSNKDKITIKDMRISNVNEVILDNSDISNVNKEDSRKPREKTKDGKKSKSKTKKKENLNITEGNEEGKKQRKKSKRKNKEVSESNHLSKNLTSVPNINQIKEFKASMIEATDIPNIKKEEDGLYPRKSELNCADVKIEPNHNVVKFGGVRKPDNLAAESLITSSKMNLTKNYYQGTFHFGGFGMDQAYTKLSKKKIDVEYDPNIVYGKSTNEKTISKKSYNHNTEPPLYSNDPAASTGFSNYNQRKYSPEKVDKSNSHVHVENSSGFNYTFNERDNVKNIKYKDSNPREERNFRNLNKGGDVNNENSTDLTNSKNPFSNKKSRKSSMNNDAYVDDEYDRNVVEKNQKRLDQIFDNKQREKNRNTSVVRGHQHFEDDNKMNFVSGNNTQRNNDYNQQQHHTKQIKMKIANSNEYTGEHKNEIKRKPSLKQKKDLAESNVNFKQLLGLKDEGSNTARANERRISKDKLHTKSQQFANNNSSKNAHNKASNDSYLNNQLNTTESSASNNQRGLHLFNHNPQVNPSQTGRFVFNSSNNEQKERGKSKHKTKDSKSCGLCEKFYKETIINNKQINLSKCGNCLNEINLESLEFYMKKYHVELIKEQKKKLQRVIESNTFSLKEEAVINKNNGWIETEKAKNDKIIREKMKAKARSEHTTKSKVPEIQINL